MLQFLWPSESLTGEGVEFQKTAAFSPQIS